MESLHQIILFRFGNLVFCFFLFVILGFPIQTYAQLEASKWFFGDGLMLDFTKSPTKLTFGNPYSLTESTSQAFNNKGQLLFYSDSERVFDRTHHTMPNGDTIVGFSSSRKGAIVIPVPGECHKYYLFTAGGSSGPDSLHQGTAWNFDLNWAMIDMEENGGLGDVISKNNFLFSPVNEEITAVHHQNGHDTWLITRNHEGSDVYAWLITANGISPPVISPYIHWARKWGYTWISVNPQGDKIALISSNLNGKTTIEVLAFDDQTGVASNPVDLDESAWTLSFSADGRYLVASGGQDVYRFDLLVGQQTGADIGGSRLLLGEHLWAAMHVAQLGIDGNIYFFIMNHYLGTLKRPEVGAKPGNYNVEVLPFHLESIAPNNLIKSYFKPDYVSDYEFDLPLSGFSYLPACFGEKMQFVSAAKSGIVTHQWDFGDLISGVANQDTNPNPTHLYSNHGTYNVQLIVENQCGADTILKEVVVDDYLSLSQPKPSYLCPGKEVRLELEESPAHVAYQWSVGDTTSFLLVNEAGKFQLTVSNGCNSLALVFFAKDAYPEIYEGSGENVFSPNGDGFNDFFEFSGKGLTHLILFDRWERQVWEGSGENVAWDGNIMGQPAPEGIYFYVGQGPGCKKEEIQMKGFLTLIR